MFITFEGGEGSGKSTQSKILYQKLKSEGRKCLLTHEPGGTKIGEEISRILKATYDTTVSGETELLLFNASRAQIVEEVIRPALDKGTIVICDRYADSTLAYQGYGRGIPLRTVRNANNLGTKGLKPDITFFLDIDPRVCFKRKTNKLDRIELEDIRFHEKVRKGFQKISKQEPERFIVIDGTLDAEKISEIIWEHVQKKLNE
jgi:dTMP kinase